MPALTKLSCQTQWKYRSSFWTSSWREKKNSIMVLFEERSQIIPSVLLINVERLIIRTSPVVKIIVVSHEERGANHVSMMAIQLVVNLTLRLAIGPLCTWLLREPEGGHEGCPAVARSKAHQEMSALRAINSLSTAAICRPFHTGSTHHNR